MIYLKKRMANPLDGLKASKVKVACTIAKAVGTGVCVGFIPFAVIAHKPILYGIPLIPVLIYLVMRVKQDLKGWYDNDSV